MVVVFFLLRFAFWFDSLTAFEDGREVEASAARAIDDTILIVDYIILLFGSGARILDRLSSRD